MDRDILDRLRSPRYASASDPFGPLCDHAAAEIEALRAEVARLTSERDVAQAVLADLLGVCRRARDSADTSGPWSDILDAAVRRAAGLEEEPAP
jgi:hypothetical protein